MSNKITITFNRCVPSPSQGYFVFYREKGSSGVYTQVPGQFFISPAVFYDSVLPAGSCYEGYIISACGNGVTGNRIPFDSCGEIGSAIVEAVTISDLSTCVGGEPFTTFKINGPAGAIVECILSVNGEIDYATASSHAVVYAIGHITTPANDGHADVNHSWAVGVDITGNTFFGYGSPASLFLIIPISGVINIATRVNLENGGTNIHGFFSIVSVNGEPVSIGAAVCAGFSTGA
jgi:hypothetical protein